MITWIPYTGYGTMEQREKPPRNESFTQREPTKDVFVGLFGWFSCVRTEVHISSCTWKRLRVIRDTILLKVLVSSSWQWGVSFTYSTTHSGIGRECNVNVCVLGSDLMLSSLWSAPPSLLEGVDMVFLTIVGRCGWGIVAQREFFLHLWLVTMVVWWGRRN
jgi:hypothetical protein